MAREAQERSEVEKGENNTAVEAERAEGRTADDAPASITGIMASPHSSCSSALRERELPLVVDTATH